MSTTAIQTRDAKLNEMIVAGKLMEAFERFYADDLTMHDGGDAFAGKDANREREQEFVDSVAKVNELTLHASAAEGDVSLSEWTYDVEFESGDRAKWRQVAVRRWREGDVVEERFYKG